MALAAAGDLEVAAPQGLEGSLIAALRGQEVPEAFDEVLKAGRLLASAKMLAALKTESIVESWMSKMVFGAGRIEGVTADDFSWSAEAGAFRLAWDGLRKAQLAAEAEDVRPMTPSGALPWAEAVASAVGCRKLKDSERSDMARKLQLKMGGVPIPRWELPALCFLQILWRMQQDRDVRYVPWKQSLSESLWDSSVRTKAPQGGEATLWKLMAKEKGLEDPEEVEMSGAQFRVSSLLRCRAFACAMVGLGGHGAWLSYVNRFVELYTARPLDGSYRSPTLEEAELADQKIWGDVLDLVRNQETWDDALYEVCVSRDCLANLLQGRLKPPKAAPTPPVPAGREGVKKRKGDGKGDGARRTRRRRLPQQDASEEEGEIVDGAPKKGICWKHLKGKCSLGDKCPFQHKE